MPRTPVEEVSWIVWVIGAVLFGLLLLQRFWRK